VSQFHNPDPLEAKDRPLVDAHEVWNTTTMTRIHRSGVTGPSHGQGVPHRTGGMVGPFVFSPDGQRLLVGTDESGIEVLRVPGLDKVGTLGWSGAHHGNLGVPCAAFTAVGDLIYTALGPSSHPRKIAGGQVWKAADLTLLREFEIKSIACAVCLSPDEKLLLTAEGGNRVHLWDSSTGRQVAEFDPQMGILRAAAFHPSGRHVAFAGEGGAAMLEVIRDGSGVRLDHIRSPQFTGVAVGAGGIRSIAYSPDGRLLATADGDDHVLRVFEAETGKAVGVLPQLGSGPVLFTPDSKAVWMAGQQAPQRFEIAGLNDRAFQDQLAIRAAGDLIHWAQVKLNSKAVPFVTERLGHQALGVLGPRSGAATSLVAKMLDLPNPELQSMGFLALAAIGPDILKREPALAAKLTSVPNQPWVRSIMPWLSATPSPAPVTVRAEDSTTGEVTAAFRKLMTAPNYCFRMEAGERGDKLDVSYEGKVGEGGWVYLVLTRPGLSPRETWEFVFRQNKGLVNTGRAWKSVEDINSNLAEARQDGIGRTVFMTLTTFKSPAEQGLELVDKLLPFKREGEVYVSELSPEALKEIAPHCSRYTLRVWVRSGYPSRWESEQETSTPPAQGGVSQPLKVKARFATSITEIGATEVAIPAAAREKLAK